MSKDPQVIEAEKLLNQLENIIARAAQEHPRMQGVRSYTKLLREYFKDYERFKEGQKAVREHMRRRSANAPIAENE